jgi:N-acetylmuramoyl-L-alanine amidase
MDLSRRSFRFLPVLSAGLLAAVFSTPASSAPAPATPTPSAPASPSPSAAPVIPASPSPAAPASAPSAPVPSAPASAVTFGRNSVDQSKFIAVAQPFGQNYHQLIILEQITDKQPCWSESGSNPTIVNPLLVKFDFTGICGRSTDANGYSIRVDGQDLGKKYTLRTRYRDNDIVLVGAPDNSAEPEIEVGRTRGFVKDFAKIQLDPGWCFAKRTFGERTLGHVYLTKDSKQPITTSTIFTDINCNVYLKDIEQAVALKFIAGFQGNTFQPLTALTREQLVSMVLEAIKTVPGAPLAVPAITAKPYPDVDSKRWSAAKIAFAKTNKIVTGYKDGTFAPEKPVTRAELLAVLKRTAEYVKTLKKQPVALASTQAAFQFSDAEKHWAADLMGQMSSYCGVATPLNESGTAFAPNASALRDYAAAATLRTLNCLQKP